MSHSSSNSSSRKIPPIGFVKTTSSSISHSNSSSVRLGERQRFSIHVLFLKPLDNDPHEHFLNRLASFIGEKVHSKGFHHVEIVIPDTDNAGGFISSSIYNGECVSMTKTKTFSNPGYTVMTFSVTGKELCRIRDYLFESKRMQLSFNGMGMYLASLPFQIGFGSRKSTFCSKHVTKALKAGGIEAVLNLNENIVTPSKLYKILRENIPNDRKVAGSVASKQQRMSKDGSMHLFSIS
jgi:hypothetical protein